MAVPGRIVIVGGGAAGLAVAEAARSAGFTGELTMLARERHLPYDRPPLSKQVLAGAWDAERVRLRDDARLSALGLTIRTGQAVSGLDTDAAEVVVENGERVPFDRLAITTGVDPVLLPGTAGLENVHVLRDLDHALRLREALAPGRRLVVIGGGVLGSEVAAVAAGRDVTVTLVDVASRPLARVVAAPVGGMLAELHAEHGVELVLGTGVRGLRSSVRGKADEVELDDGRRLPADVVLVAVGAQPVTSWLAGSTVQLGSAAPGQGSRGVLCTAGGRATEDVYAAGDVAAWWSPRTEDYVRVEHRLNASEQGRAVALAMLDPAARPSASVPYFWSDHYDLKLQCFGLPAAGDEFVVVEGSLAQRCFVGASLRDGVTTAVVGAGMQRRLRAWRSRIGLAPSVPA